MKKHGREDQSPQAEFLGLVPGVGGDSLTSWAQWPRHRKEARGAVALQNPLHLGEVGDSRPPCPPPWVLTLWKCAGCFGEPSEGLESQ